MKNTIAKMNYGPDAIYGVAKLFATPRGKEGKVHKTLLAGVILTPESLTPTIENGGEVERMYECEVIIIPKKIYEKFLPGGAGEIQNILLGGYGCADNYDKRVK